MRRTHPFSIVRACAAGLVGSAALLAMCPSTFAQSVASEPERLFDEGRAAMQAGDYSTACQKFGESYRLEPALGTQLNLAHCQEERGQVLAAWTLFRRVRGELPAGDRRIPVADQHIASLAARIAHLRLVVDPNAAAGTSVRVDGALADGPEATGTFPIEPGKHEVSVTIPGRAEQTRRLEFTEGATLEFRVIERTAPGPGLRNDARATAPDSPSVAGTSDTHPDATRRTAEYVAAGVGLVGLLVGTITGIEGLHQESIGNANCSDVTRTCNQKGVDANRSARSLATVSTVGFAVGIVGVGLGGYLYFSAARPAHSASSPSRSASISLAWSGQW
ncbi:MAG TPA: hypothetical protein VMI54_17805 [Polyangiaceae bacterium]|nr:hypothetical protein [Polyangiaceae bacterium]